MAVTLSQVPLRRSPLAVTNFYNSLSPVKQVALERKARDSALSVSSSVSPANSADQIWFRVNQLANKHKQFTENAIRALLFAAKPRVAAKSRNGNSWIKGNGLAPAIRKCGRSVLINEPMFAKWIETGSCGQGSQE